jgi:hypothetical protein
VCDEGDDVERITRCRTPMCMPQVSSRVSGPSHPRRQNPDMLPKKDALML